jgi:trimeric autotransporter adhesin
VVWSLTKTTGRWTHKWGGEFRSYLSNYSDARGKFWFRSANTFTTGNIIQAQGQTVDAVTAQLTGSPIVSALLGAGDIQAGENAVLLALSAKYGAFYSQSDWRATSRLTVNLGVRYDLQQAPSERYNRISSWSYNGTNPFGAPGNLMFPGHDGLGKSLYRMPRDNWGPRLGMAYRVTEEWVIRSGFGVTYTPSNTGYFGGPYYFGAQNFVDRTNDPTAAQYGAAPAGRLVAPYNQVTQLVPAIGSNRRAPQYYGDGSNEPRFDYDGMKNGKILQWNLFVERKLGRTWLAQLGYSGARGYHLQLGRWAVNNDQDLPDALLSQWRQAYIANNGTNPANQLVPNPFQNQPGTRIPFNGVFGNPTVPRRNLELRYTLNPNNLLGSPQGFYTYNAMMAQLQRSFSGGLLFNVHYTWSRTIENWFGEAQGNNYAENAGTAPGTLDRRNLSNSYSISPNDIPHRLVATWVWTPPMGKGQKLDLRNGLANAVLGGWNLGGVFVAQSGQPQQGFTGASGSVTGRGDRLSGVAVEVPKELQKWYTGATPADRTVALASGRQIVVCRYCFLKYSSDAFAGRTVTLANGNIAPDVYWWGNTDIRYGDIRGNGRWNVNLSLQKQFSIRERLQMQLSAEATNVFNNTQFRPNMNAGLGATFTNVSAAQRAQGIRPGMMQNDNFGTWGMSTFDPRQVELRLRLFF